MSNERLRAAIDKAGLTADALALKVGVDEKTVRRWISASNTPRKNYRRRVAEATGVSEAEIWPEEELRIDGRDQAAEILAAYAHANDPAAPHPAALLAAATTRIDLLDPTLASTIADPQVYELLRRKANDGVAIRLLLADPESVYLTLRDAELGYDIRLVDIGPSAQAAQHTIELLRPLLAAGAQAQTFVTATSATILRSDNEMLAGLQLHATPAEKAPTLHLTRHSDHGLLAQLTDHFDRIWNTAQPVRPLAAG